ESPAQGVPITGPTVVRGFALDCSTGSAATVVRVYAGTNTSGRLLGMATLGAGARDVASMCSGRGNGQVNAGFSFNVDPAALAGAQAITIAADTTSGPASTTLSLNGSSSPNPNANTSGNANTSYNPNYATNNSAYNGGYNPNYNNNAYNSGYNNGYNSNYNGSYPYNNTGYNSTYNNNGYNYNNGYNNAYGYNNNGYNSSY